MEVATLPAGRRPTGESKLREAARLLEAGRLRPRQRVRAVHRLEKAQTAASIALGAVSSYLEADMELPAFFGHLGETVAGLVGARRVAFWRLSSHGALAVQPEPFGFRSQSPVRSLRIPLARDGKAVAERIVFRDELELRNGTCAELDELWRENGLRGMRNSIAVSWPAGDRRIGALAAYDSQRGFTTDDAWVLRIAATATGLVWQYREAEEELDVAVERLEEAMAARRQLLANVASGGDEARRRFASALHDDSLQLLTAAELQLQRIRNDSSNSRSNAQLDQLAATIKKVEDSLRRLLITVSPEALDLKVGLKEAIRDRLETLRVHTGIEPDLDLQFPDDLPNEVELIVFKNVAEALTNVEKHSHATRIRVAASALDGGVVVEVADDGAGFVVDECMHVPGHLGLLAMKERAQLMGGWCRIASEPGQGAKVKFWVPAA
ncbi:MAG TPA: sensor histidine kinase [Candidatus Eisenbacteria bacterium]|nr:sensor histidine kinase [Candidatus Eisenbacteria bacterium]